MKPQSLIVRVLAGVIGTLFLGTNCLFAYSTESNIWAERRKAREQRSSPTLLASLPVGSSVQALSTQFPTPRSLENSLSQTLIHSVPKRFLKNHEGLLSALSPAYGTIRKVSLSPKSSANSPVVIHIQDVHQNLDAQKNIGRLVDSLLTAKLANLIALEGTWGDINLQPFRDFPHRQAVEQSADYLLKENKISGPIHTVLTGTGPLPLLIGIDDPTHYNANVEAYRQSAPRIEEIKKSLAQKKATLDQEKARVFTPQLKTLEAAVEAYREGQSSLGNFVEILTNPSLHLEVPSSLRIFQKTLAIEKTLNFKQVERERADLIDHLVQQLSRREMDELTRHSVAYRSSQVSYADFYTYLKGLCHQAGVALDAYPAMEEYIRYVLLADRIDAESLLSDLTSLERKAFASLARSPEAQTLVDQSRAAYLTAKLVDFSLTPDEWKEYLSLTNVEKQSTDFHSFEAFYREAETRDQAMADNLFKAMGSEQGNSVAILVTGGYHSAGLTAQLSQAGATVISVVPKIEKVETTQGSAYLSVFAQEKTPLEKLFVGEKLFLAQNPISQPTRQILAPILMVLTTVILGEASGILDLNSLYQSLGGLGTLSDLVSSNGGAVAITLTVGGALYVANAIKDKGGEIGEFVVTPLSGTGNLFARTSNFLKRVFVPFPVSLSFVKSAVASQPIPVPFSNHLVRETILFALRPFPIKAWIVRLTLGLLIFGTAFSGQGAIESVMAPAHGNALSSQPIKVKDTSSPSPAEIQKLITDFQKALLINPQSTETIEAGNMIVALGPLAAPFLSDLIDNQAGLPRSYSGNEHEKAILHVLFQFNEMAISVVGSFAQKCHNDESLTLIFDWLGARGAPAATEVPKMINILMRSMDTAYPHALSGRILNGEIPQYFFPALRAFARMGPGAVEAYPILVQLSTDTRLTSAIDDAADKMGPPTDDVIPVLIDSMESNNIQVFSRAIDIIGKKIPFSNVDYILVDHLHSYPFHGVAVAKTYRKYGFLPFSAILVLFKNALLVKPRFMFQNWNEYLQKSSEEVSLAGWAPIPLIISRLEWVILFSSFGGIVLISRAKQRKFEELQKEGDALGLCGYWDRWQYRDRILESLKVLPESKLVFAKNRLLQILHSCGSRERRNVLIEILRKIHVPESVIGMTLLNKGLNDEAGDSFSRANSAELFPFHKEIWKVAKSDNSETRKIFLQILNNKLGVPPQELGLFLLRKSYSTEAEHYLMLSSQQGLAPHQTELLQIARNPKGLRSQRIVSARILFKKFNYPAHELGMLFFRDVAFEGDPSFSLLNEASRYLNLAPRQDLERYRDELSNGVYGESESKAALAANLLLAKLEIDFPALVERLKENLEGNPLLSSDILLSYAKIREILPMVANNDNLLNMLFSSYPARLVPVNAVPNPASHQVLSLLQRLGKNAKGAIPYLIVLQSNPRYIKRWTEKESRMSRWGSINDSQGEEVDVAKEESIDLSKEIEKTLTSIGTPSSAEIPGLFNLSKSHDPKVKRAALRYLKKIEDSPNRIVAATSLVLGDPELSPREKQFAEDLVAENTQKVESSLVALAAKIPDRLKLAVDWPRVFKRDKAYIPDLIKILPLAIWTETYVTGNNPENLDGWSHGNKETHMVTVNFKIELSKVINGLGPATANEIPALCNLLIGFPAIAIKVLDEVVDTPENIAAAYGQVLSENPDTSEAHKFALRKIGGIGKTTSTIEKNGPCHKSLDDATF
jgi:hypothetical protein